MRSVSDRRELRARNTFPHIVLVAKGHTHFNTLYTARNRSPLTDKTASRLIGRRITDCWKRLCALISRGDFFFTFVGSFRSIMQVTMPHRANARSDYGFSIGFSDWLPWHNKRDPSLWLIGFSSIDWLNRSISKASLAFCFFNCLWSKTVRTCASVWRKLESTKTYWCGCLERRAMTTPLTCLTKHTTKEAPNYHLPNG